MATRGSVFDNTLNETLNNALNNALSNRLSGGSKGAFTLSSPGHNLIIGKLL